MSNNKAKILSSKLKKIPLLSCLNDIARDSFAEKCRWVEYNPNHSVIERGMSDTNVYFIITGTVHVLNYSETGRAITYAILKDGDMFVIDRGLTNYKDKVIIACVNGEFTVKRYKIERGRPVLKPQNPNYSDIHFTEYDEITVWGVVTSVIHPV